MDSIIEILYAKIKSGNFKSHSHISELVKVMEMKYAARNNNLGKPAIQIQFNDVVVNAEEESIEVSGEELPDTNE